MNLSPLQRAARNLFANQTGVNDPATLELAFLDPNVAKLAEDMLTCALSGPFGDLTLIDAADESDHGCKAMDGYVLALEETIAHINGIVTPAPSVEAGMFLIQQFDQLITDIQARLDAVRQPELPLDTLVEEPGNLVEGIAAWLSQLTGQDVTVVRL